MNYVYMVRVAQHKNLLCTGEPLWCRLTQPPTSFKVSCCSGALMFSKEITFTQTITESLRRLAEYTRPYVPRPSCSSNSYFASDVIQYDKLNVYGDHPHTQKGNANKRGKAFIGGGANSQLVWKLPRWTDRQTNGCFTSCVFCPFLFPRSCVVRCCSIEVCIKYVLANSHYSSTEA